MESTPSMVCVTKEFLDRGQLGKNEVNMKVAALSLDPQWESKSASLRECRPLLDRAAEKGAELAILPEMTLTGFSMNTASIAEDLSSSETIETFSRVAAELNLPILFGVVVRDGDRATNNAVLVDAKGAVVANYAKIHPFSFAEEDQFYRGGRHVVSVSLNGMTIGLTICFDLRFPELYTALSRQCDMIVNIANWPGARLMHWSTLLRARAIENQVFLIGVNRTGTDGKGIEYIRSTELIDPWGDAVSPIESEGALDMFELNMESLVSIRENFPTRKDRKPELYRTII